MTADSKAPTARRGLWLFALVCLLLVIAIKACNYVPNARDTAAPSRTSQTEDKPGCLDFPEPTPRCIATFKEQGFSAGFVRAGWTAFHYADVWYAATRGDGIERFDKTVYTGKVIPSLKKAKSHITSRKERTFFEHEFALISLLRLHGAYAGLQDSTIDPVKLQAFRVLTGTTPQGFAQSTEVAATTCMAAITSDVAGLPLTGPHKNAGKSCLESSRPLVPR